MDLAKILSAIISSEDMKNHLLHGGLERSCDYIEKIIFSSPVSMEEKYELLNQIEHSVYEDVENRILSSDKDTTVEWKNQKHLHRIENFQGYLTTVRLAIELQQIDGVFAIETCDYNSDIIETDKRFANVCSSFEEAVDWIRADICKGEYAPNDTHWHTASLWVKNEINKFENICTYEFIDGVACYATLDDDFADKQGVGSLMSDKQLNLEVPFKAGDIIEVNPTPYAPKYRALVLCIEDNHDCCAVQVVTLNSAGRCVVGGLKHNHVALDVWGSFSPLYTASLYTDKLKKEETSFQQISEYIDGDESRGGKVWDYFSEDDKKIEDYLNSL